MYLFVDCETTGLPKDWNAPISQAENWPRIVSISWILADKNQNIIDEAHYHVLPVDYGIPPEATALHGITTEFAKQHGEPIIVVLKHLISMLDKAEAIIAHNIKFDGRIIHSEIMRNKIRYSFRSYKRICTMELGTNYCAIKGRYDDYKLPTLHELYWSLFGEHYTGMHNAQAEAAACMRCFFGMLDAKAINEDFTVNEKVKRKNRREAIPQHSSNPEIDEAIEELEQDMKELEKAAFQVYIDKKPTPQFVIKDKDYSSDHTSFNAFYNYLLILALAIVFIFVLWAGCS